MKQILCAVIAIAVTGCASHADLVSETDGAWVNMREYGKTELMYCTVRNPEKLPVCTEPRLERLRRAPSTAK